MTQAPSVSIKSAGDLAVNMASLQLQLRAENLSLRTQETYIESVAQLARFLVDQGMPQDVASIRREHVEAFIAHLLERWKPSTASNRYRGCQAFSNETVNAGKQHSIQGCTLYRWPFRMPGGVLFVSVCTLLTCSIKGSRCVPRTTSILANSAVAALKTAE